MPFERELRRWTRLRPEILTRCRVRILDRGRKIGCALLDLSPGGIGLLVPNGTWNPLEGIVQVEIRFKGQSTVVRAAETRRWTNQEGGIAMGLAWRMEPEAWSEVERRDKIRLTLPPDTLLARIPLRHAHNVWTRLSVVDINADFGFQVETRGGPAYLLPGHRAQLKLDLPHLHHHGWDCQVLWVRAAEGQGMRLGMRVLDPDPALEEILSEWLQIRRDWAPLRLQMLGFGKDSLPGQYRFRKVEEIAENLAVANFLEAMSRRKRLTGMEVLHATARKSEHDTVQLGCWDGNRLVAAMTLEHEIGELASEDTHSKVSDFAIEPEWIVPEVFLGLWEQTVRLFLSSGNLWLWVWCPPGRDELFRLAGMEPATGPYPPTPWGTWMTIHRKRLTAGAGMNAIRWAILYAGVSSFFLQHQRRGISVPSRLTRWRKLGIFGLLRDWREPRERRKLREAIELWGTEVSQPDPVDAPG